jgi:hypothetical protein
MAARSRFAAIALAAGSLAGTVLVRRRSRQHQVRVDLYFADGSMISLPGESPDAAAILAAAREVLAAG